MQMEGRICLSSAFLWCGEVYVRKYSTTDIFVANGVSGIDNAIYFSSFYVLTSMTLYET